MTPHIVTAALALALAGCTGPTAPPRAQPAPSPTSASPTAAPSPTPAPNAWDGDPDGKAACDTVRALYEAGPLATNRPNPGLDGLGVAADRAARSTRPRIAGAGVDLMVRVRDVRQGGGRTAEIGMESAAYTLGRICHEERYYLPPR